MAKGYSKDLRARAVALVEDGESRREAARVLGLGASTTIRWIERWATTGSVAALPGTGHSRSPLEAHRQWLLDLVAAEPDLTLEEIRSRLKSEKRLKTGATSVWRFYERHDCQSALDWDPLSASKRGSDAILMTRERAVTSIDVSIQGRSIQQRSRSRFPSLRIFKLCGSTEYRESFQ